MPNKIVMSFEVETPEGTALPHLMGAVRDAGLAAKDAMARCHSEYRVVGEAKVSFDTLAEIHKVND